MANKNKHVVIGLFTTRQQALEAAESIKQWDKANDEIKLGGMGIVTLTADDKFNVDKVGDASASGTGAKAGAVLGVTAGILSGGITLVGGAIAGILGGSLLGALKNKGIDLDNVRHTLALRLKEGHVGLAVMADDFEVEPTSAELTRLGGEVLLVPLDEELQQMARAQTGSEGASAQAPISISGNVPRGLA